MHGRVVGIAIGIGICQIKDKQIILFSLETAWVQE